MYLATFFVKIYHAKNSFCSSIQTRGSNGLEKTRLLEHRLLSFPILIGGSKFLDMIDSMGHSRWLELCWNTFFSSGEDPVLVCINTMINYPIETVISKVV